MKTYEFDVQGDYGHGYETATTEESYTEARRRLREYRDNAPGVPFRIKSIRRLHYIQQLPGCYMVLLDGKNVGTLCRRGRRWFATYPDGAAVLSPPQTSRGDGLYHLLNDKRDDVPQSVEAITS